MPPPGFSGAYIRRKIQKTAGFWPSNRPLEHRGTSALHGGQVAPILRENTHLTGSASGRSLCGRQARQFTWTGVGTPMNPPPEGQAAPLLSVACARRVLNPRLKAKCDKSRRRDPIFEAEEGESDCPTPRTLPGRDLSSSNARPLSAAVTRGYDVSVYVVQRMMAGLSGEGRMLVVPPAKGEDGCLILPVVAVLPGPRPRKRLILAQ